MAKRLDSQDEKTSINSVKYSIRQEKQSRTFNKQRTERQRKCKEMVDGLTANHNDELADKS